MPFRLIGKSGAENEDGVIVSYQGEDRYRYKLHDGRRFLFYTRDIDDDPSFTIAVSLDLPLYWHEREDLGAINQSELTIINKNIVDALLVLGKSAFILEH